MAARDRIVVIWNPAAGRASTSAAARLRRRLAGTPGIDLREARSRLHAVGLARAAARGHAALVVAAGGDGTLNAVATGLAGSGSGAPPLGIVPLGTASDIARGLGIPTTPRDAWDLLESGRPDERTLDLLEARWSGRSHVVLNVLAACNGAEVTHGTGRATKRLWGPWAYLRSAARVLRALRRWRVALELDDAPAVAATLLTLVAANGRLSAGGLAVAPEADPADGLMDVVALQDAPPREIAAVIARLLADHDIHGEHVVRTRCAFLRVTCAVPLPLAIDGDPLGTTRRLEVRVRPRALRVRGGAPCPPRRGT